MTTSPTPAHSGTAPLAGKIVLDLTQHLAGPYGTQILADLGARVIKIEPPAGDPTRDLPPYFVAGESAYFLSVNRNKEALCLNLKNPKGRELFLRLVERADVVFENFRPGTTDRLGISYADLREVNPRLVMCSVSGFGQHGPYQDLPAFDIIVQALSGGMSITGEEDGQPVRAGVPLGDLAGGMYGVIGVLAGLSKVADTGEGSYVDIAMLDCQVSMLSYMAAYYLVSGEVPGPQGRAHRSIPTYRAFTCAAGREIVVAANTERMWTQLCAALGLDELTTDERFRRNDDRLRHKAELDAILEPRFAEWDADAILDRLRELAVPCAPINTLNRALADPQVAVRDMVLHLAAGDGASVRVAGNPVKMTGHVEPRSYPPHLGQHTAEILRSLLALSPEQIRALSDEEVIGGAPGTGDRPVATTGSAGGSAT